MLIRSKSGSKEYEWSGYLARDEAGLDLKNRMVNLVVEVDDPFSREKNGSALTIGMFVTVEIDGRVLNNVFVLPRSLIHNGGSVRVMKDGKLKIKKVEIVAYENDTVFVKSGIKESDDVITTPLSIAIPGMQLKTGSL